jgi:hypothetical protein
MNAGVFAGRSTSVEQFDKDQPVVAENEVLELPATRVDARFSHRRVR